MSSATGTNKAAAALSGPPQRPRSDKSNLPKPPGSAPATAATAAAPEPAAPQSEPAAPQPPAPVAAPTPTEAVTPVAPAAVQPGSAPSKARRQLAARNAEQTFLPLVSRVAKLSEYVEQAELAIADAIAMGVDPGQLEDTLRSIARKAEVPFSNLPESVRKAVSEA